MQYEVLEEVDYFILRTSGIFRSVDHSRMFSLLASSSSWKKGMNLLIDHRQTRIDKTDLTDVESAAQDIILFSKDYGPKSCAAVMQSEGISRAHYVSYEVNLQTEINFRIFSINKYEAAVLWLKSQRTAEGYFCSPDKTGTRDKRASY